MGGQIRVALPDFDQVAGDHSAITPLLLPEVQITQEQNGEQTPQVVNLFDCIKAIVLLPVGLVEQRRSQPQIDQHRRNAQRLFRVRNDVNFVGVQLRT